METKQKGHFDVRFHNSYLSVDVMSVCVLRGTAGGGTFLFISLFST